MKVELNEIIPYLGLSKLTDKGNYYQSCCPIHNDSNPSFVIYKNSYHYRCFSCGENGHVYQLLEDLTGKSVYTTFNLKRSDYRSRLFSKPVDIEKPKKFYNKDISFSISGNYYNVYDNVDVLSYIRKKNITDKFIYDFNIRYMYKAKVESQRINEKDQIEKSDIKLHNRLLIPIIENKKIINYELRDFTEKSKVKCLYIKYCPTNTLFNIDNLDRNKPLYVTEGISDLPQIYTYISKNCTAPFGISITDNQIKLLNEFKQIIFLPDNDEQGLNFISKLYEVLDREFYIALLDADIEDPGKATLRQIKKAIENKIISVEYFLKKYQLLNKKEEIKW